MTVFLSAFLNRSTRAIVTISLLLPSLVAAQRGGSLELLPDQLAPGADLVIAVAGQPSGSDRQLLLRPPTGPVIVLQDLVLDDTGGVLLTMALPPVAPGSYQVELTDYSNTLISVPLSVAAAVAIAVSPDNPVSGFNASVIVSNLRPGTLTLTVNDEVWQGPVAVSSADFTSFQPFPVGPPGEVVIGAINQVGGQVLGRGELSVQRVLPAISAPELVSFDPPASTPRPGQLISLSGAMRLPAGTQPSDYNWSLVIISSEGQHYPLNTLPVAFTPIPGSDDQYRYETDVLMPSTATNFPLLPSSTLTDLGFVYENPQRGETGVVTLMTANINTYEQVTVRGRVIDEATGVGISGAIVSVQAETFLIDPENPPFNSKASAGSAKGTTTTASGLAALYGSDNQFSLAYQDLPTFDDGLTATGCPITLELFETDADGRFEFTFSPLYTEFLSALFARDISSGTVRDSGLRLTDQFTIRISGLHLNPSFGIASISPLGTPQFTGKRYDFLRHPDTGQFFFRETPDGPFDQLVTSGEQITTLEVYSGGRPQLIDTAIFIEGLAPPVDAASLLFSGLITFPQLAGTALGSQISSETVTLNMAWPESTHGLFEGAVTINDVGSFPLVRALTNPKTCSPLGVFYAAQIPGLALRSGVLSGEIAGNAGGRELRKALAISTQDGPSWFHKPGAPYQSAAITWSPKKITIIAREPDYENAGASTSVELDVGSGNSLPVDNQNREENVFVTQTITSGVADEQIRSKSTTTSVFGRTQVTDSKSLALPGSGSTSFDFGAKVGAETLVSAKACGATPYACSGATTYGSKTPEELIPTIVTPLFRYGWGVPPIASAVVGADFFLSVLLTNFGYVDYADAAVLVNSVLEPATNAGLDVFFDFSAIFGLVNASMNAIPNIGVGMPVVLVDSVFDQSLSGPCFKFLLKLKLQVSVGICPVCIEGTYEDTPISAAEPAGCNIFSLDNAKGGLTATPPSGDTLSLSTNHLGSAFAVRAETDGIHAQRVNTFKLGQDYLLDSGPGAMQPAVAFLRHNRAVAVWSQSSLNAAQFQQRAANDYDCTEADLLADPLCDDLAQWDPLQYQHMVYAIWDGNEWGATQNLTNPSTGEGGVKLASCMNDDAMCPSGGQVYAVWHRDMAADINQHQIKLYEAFFDGSVWSTPQAIDPATPGKDVQPSPVYRLGQPVVVFVRNEEPLATGGALNLANRNLVYRFAGSTTRGASQLSGYVASPSAAVASDGTVVVAYTRSAPTDPFIGSRRALQLATLSQCSGGNCSQVISTQRRDQFDRPLYVEKPSLVIDDQDNLVMFYRWLSPGDKLIAGDPFGPQGYGNIGTHQVPLADITTVANHIPITMDGAVNWQVQGAYDPGLKSLLVMSEQGGPASALKIHADKPGASQRLKLAGARQVSVISMPALPDLRITALDADAGQVLSSGQVVSLTAEISNAGTPLTPSELVSVSAVWNGPEGVGTLLDSVADVQLDDTGRTIVSMSFAVPPGTPPDVQQQVRVTVNHSQAVVESDAGNNTRSLTFNALPVPVDVLLSLDRRGEMAFASWTPSNDSRVTGYQVYRRADAGAPVVMNGMTPVAGYVDLLSVPGSTYQYCVRSLSLSGQMSDCSPWAEISVTPVVGDALFQDSFEEPV